MVRKIFISAAACVITAIAGVSLWHSPHTAASLSEPKPVPANVAASLLNWPAVSHVWAGDGLRGFGDGKLTAARFADPYGLARDSHGNLYISDAGDNNKIRKIAPDGSVTTFAGSVEGFADGNGSTAAFNTPSGLVMDAADNLYVADTGNNAIRKITPQGVVTTVAGDGQAGSRDGLAAQARFNGPLGLDVDKAGNIYVADTYNDSVRRIALNGQVTTLIGGTGAGFQDGPLQSAQLNTPCNLLLDAAGNLLIADTKNNAVRKLSVTGKDDQLTTLAHTLPGDHDALLRRPAGLALDKDGLLYIGDIANGRILQMSTTGEIGSLQNGSNPTSLVAPASDNSLHLTRPTALLFDHEGLLVADPATYQIIRIARLHEGQSVAGSVAEQVEKGKLQTRVAEQIISAFPAVVSGAFPWPFKPQQSAHEIVGTLGEVRGNNDGESRDHLHGGLDVQAAMGTPVLAVADEKVSRPTAAGGFGETGEALSLDLFSYVHMRVGRTADGKPIDPVRFLIQNDDRGQIALVRVKRGTRFAVGDQLGTVNRMYHTHLALHVAGTEINPLVLPFPGMRDDIAPTIRQIQIAQEDGPIYAKSQKGRLLLPVGGRFDVVVEAYDQMNGNQKRRQLGLYRVGYQLLSADGKSIAGIEQPLITMDFLRLPDDDDAVKIAYASESGITVYGSKTTRMLYQVTNQLHDGLSLKDVWDSKGIAAGDYILRIYAADFAGNVAMAGRDLPITLGP